MPCRHSIDTMEMGHDGDGARFRMRVGVGVPENKSNLVGGEIVTN